MPRKPKEPRKCDKCGHLCNHTKKYKGRCEQFMGKYYCGKCFRNIPRNPFFIPLEQRKQKTIGKFSLSTAEKRIMHQKYIKQGYTSESAWHQVNILLNQMRYAKLRKAKEMKAKKIAETNKVKETKLKNTKFKKSFDTL